MRPLNDVLSRCTDKFIPPVLEGIVDIPQREFYQSTHERIKATCHANCIFNRYPSGITDVSFTFDDAGCLHGTLCCGPEHQGYDDMVHGGVVAAVIDASMTQCLMGHEVVAYTTNLAIQYRKPVKIGLAITLKSFIKSIRVGVLYVMACEVVQNTQVVVSAKAHFYKVN